MLTTKAEAMLEEVRDVVKKYEADTLLEVMAMDPRLGGALFAIAQIFSRVPTWHWSNLRGAPR